ncbi:hypothetical protein [Serratia plymuthica]|uniref:Uncharacterized protein n=1 Tax=Serratia plymuthica TaxID=82996 RepID=A0A7T2SP82_SERPL|nr:hypothetical protein [Serratia plymuthica]QPS18907.1 hypothetical protein I6G64_14975 [Serratia plymuthica]QPS56462.1 hypothetical protein I6G53_02690 [Serratia plymuthica]QPS65180.1 hypothetical protein I6G52_10770 [Serratia plymuthica]RKS62352.1 hypothetical protein C8E17_1532 [Serratia plymuthica]CAI1954780.1 Uncharacterised protein [Serratia plymuthica]
MKKLIKYTLLSSVLFTSFAHAQWLTQVDDDLFTGGKKATLVGDLQGADAALIFDCTKQKLTISYAERYGEQEAVSATPFNLIVKVDAGDAHKMDAQSKRRNSKYLEISSDDREQIEPILKSLLQAKSKVLVGLETKDGGNQFSASGSVAGSTKAADQFIKACELKI